MDLIFPHPPPLSSFAPPPEGTKLYIATPCYGQMVLSAYAEALFDTQALLTERGVPCRVGFHSSAAISQGRNIMVGRFMNTDCTHLIFIDADMGWKPESVWRLLSAACLPDHEVVCGAYPMKTPPPHTLTVAFLPTPDASVERHPVTGFWDIRAVGAGFLMMQRSVIERLFQLHPEKKITRDGALQEYAIFDYFIDSEGRYLGE